MKIGMNLLLWTDIPTKEHVPLLRKIKDWGFDGVEFPLDDMSLSDTRILAQALKELNLDATGIVAMPAEKADPVSSNAALRDAAVSYMKNCIDKAVILGADIIAGPLFQGLGRFTGQGPSEKEKEWCAQTYRHIVPYAIQHGVVLAGEPINRFETYFVNTIEQGTDIVDRVNSPSFGLHVDTYHGNMEELSMPNAWRKAGKRIKHIHISENTRGIPGTGTAISSDLFEVLKEIEYDGWLTIEAFGTSVPDLASRLHIWRCFAPSEEDIALTGRKFISACIKRAEL